MKILVIEDSPKHQASALETLAGHDVTIAKSYDDAMALMNKRTGWKEGYKLIPLPFEVVLTDMNLPMSKDKLADGVFKSSEEVPYGFVLSLMAALRGAKFVAMVTDANHHYGAMSAATDHLQTAFYGDPWGKV